MMFLFILVPNGDLRRLLQMVDCTLSVLEVSTVTIHVCCQFNLRTFRNNP